MRTLLPLLVLLSCTGSEPGPQTDTDIDVDCPQEGLYGDPDWSLEVRSDCSAFLMGFCGEGEIDALSLTGTALSAELIWSWYGGGPTGGNDDPATLEGTAGGGSVDATLAWLERSEEVYAELGVTPGEGLGLGACPLD